MHTRRLAPAALLASLLLACPATLAQEGSQPAAAPAQLPAAEQVFEDYIAAIGGRDALARHENRVLHGAHLDPRSQSYQVITIWAAKPDKLMARIELPALGVSVRSTDGESTWGTNTDGAPFNMSGNERVQLLDSAFFAGETGYKDRYTEYETTGVVTIAERPAYRVAFTTKAGVTGACFFDVESKLLVGRVLSGTAATGDLVLLRDYKEFEGLLLPTIQQQQSASEGVVAQFKFNWIEVNVDDLPDFSPPAETSASAGSGD